MSKPIPGGAAAVAATRPSVLVVDDETEVLHAIEDTLEGEYKVYAEASPAAAIELLKELPDLAVILSDQRMPQMRGDEFLARAQEISPATRLLLTAYADLDAVTRAVNNGHIYGYVSKPWSADQLKMIIFRAVEHYKLVRELAHERELLRDLMDNVPDAIYIKDLEHRYLRVNKAEAALLNLPRPEDAAGMTDGALFPADLARIVYEEDDNIYRTGNSVIDRQMRVLLPTGELVWQSTTKAPFRDQSGRIAGLVGISRDITERKQVDLALARQRDLYSALSQTNQVIVRGTGREELFQAVCRIAVEHGRFRFAWIGLIDKNDKRVKPVAQYGEDAGYVKQLDISIDETVPARAGWTGRALRTGRRFVLNDYGDERAQATLRNRDAARRAGVRAYGAFPIRQGGVVAGVINFYSTESGFFTEDLIATLGEIAQNLSFALDNFEREAERARAEQALRAAEEQFRGLVEQSIAGIYIIQDEKFAYVNPRLAEIFGYGFAAELIGRDPLSTVAEKDRGIVADNIRRRIEGEVASVSYQFTGLRKDGSMIDVGVHGARATHGGRPAVIGLMQDISEKKLAEEQIQRYVVQLETAFMHTVEVATTLSEMRDSYTAGHERRAGHIAVAIAAELGFDARRQEGLRVAGYLHDIGKITIPSEILSKPGKLTAVEFDLIRGHSQASYDVLKNVEFPWPVAEVVLQHHERQDGSGYPRGLKGDAILLEARILAVADVIEAMSSHRPYRPGLGIDKALAEIERGRGTSYDPAVADACLKLFRDGGYTIPA